MVLPSQYPAHVPEPLQVAWPARAIIPLGIGEHVPGALSKLQAPQGLVHSALQQTPSAQNPLMHSPGCEQASPFDLSRALSTPPMSAALSPFFQHVLLTVSQW